MTKDERAQIVDYIYENRRAPTPEDYLLAADAEDHEWLVAELHGGDEHLAKELIATYLCGKHWTDDLLKNAAKQLCIDLSDLDNEQLQSTADEVVNAAAQRDVRALLDAAHAYPEP